MLCFLENVVVISVLQGSPKRFYKGFIRSYRVSKVLEMLSGAFESTSRTGSRSFRVSNMSVCVCVCVIHIYIYIHIHTYRFVRVL